MAGTTHKRKQILVDTELQLGMSINMVGWLYFYVVSFALFANAPSIWAVLTEPETETAYFDAVQHMQWFTQYTVMPLALTFVCVAAHSLVFTHRVAGPIYRIRTVLHEMIERRYPSRSVTLRDKDYFKDVADELNKVIETLRDDAARQRRMNQETMTGIQELVRAMDPDGRPRPEAMVLAHQALEKAERLDRHLAAVDPAATGTPAADAGAAAMQAAGATPVTAEPANR